LNYREAVGWLFRTQRFGIKLGLESTHRLFDSLGVSTLEARILHVAGTNGKGSVCAMLDSICRAAGYRTALFTSPHLISFRERIQVNGELISEEAVAEGLTAIRALVADWDRHPTFFEITTALALAYFRDAAAEIIVLETGMGGRLDSTNATTPVVSILTPIDYDHQQWLGNSLTSIAGEKAGIIKAHVPVVSAGQPEEAAAVITARARECEAPLTFVREGFTRFPVALLGSHQKQNAALAVAALAAAGIACDDDTLGRGLTTVSWPGRFQPWNERTIIDGAHNPAGARSLVKTWREIFGEEKATVILAVLADKALPEICAALAPITGRAFLPHIRSDRAADPVELEAIIHKELADIQTDILPSFAEAWSEAQRSSAPILITGSLHFAGEALAHLRGETAAVEECLQ
jgi:dihydrofolate synthase/folylpolyglutamate synthase